MGKPDANKLIEVLKDHRIRIIDDSSLLEMALVDQIKESFISRMKQELPGWQAFSKQNSFSVPDTRGKTR